MELDTQVVSNQHDKVRMNIWVRRDVYRDITDVAKLEDISVSDVVRNALKVYARKYKSKNKRS